VEITDSDEIKANKGRSSLKSGCKINAVCANNNSQHRLTHTDKANNSNGQKFKDSLPTLATHFT